MRPCAVFLDAQRGSSLTWEEVRDHEFVWDFDDGGSDRDSVGFLAAAVYETAGTYHPRVAVDGQPWPSIAIDVRDPVRTVCVGQDFSKCPSAARRDRFRTLAPALAATRTARNRHVLLERGGTYGALPTGQGPPTMIGAYGDGPKPSVSASDVRFPSSWSFVDLDIVGGGSTVIKPSSGGGLLLRITGRGTAKYHWISTEVGIFIIDSVIETKAPYPLFVGDRTPWLVVKGSTLDRLSAGQSTIRIDGDGQERILIQDSIVLGTGKQHGLTIRGATKWVLIQGCHFDEQTGTKESQPGDSRLQEKIVFERNSYDRKQATTGINWGFSFQGRDMVVRNNVVFGAGGQMDYRVVSGDAGPSENIWLLNNTSIDNDTNGIRMGNCPTCVAKNNLVYSKKSNWGDCITQLEGVEAGRNWCFTDDECLDPVSGGSDCHDPRFESLRFGDDGFARPAAGTRGLGQANRAVPVWTDYSGERRDQFDIGAIERN